MDSMQAPLADRFGETANWFEPKYVPWSMIGTEPASFTPAAFRSRRQWLIENIDSMYMANEITFHGCTSST